MHFGLIEQLIKILWVCLLIKWFIEKLVICLLSQNIKHFGQSFHLNYDFKLAGEKRLFDISSLDEWRTQAYENAKLFKEKVKRWHDKRIQKRELKVGEYVLFYNSRFRFFAGKLLSKWEGPYVIEEVYRSGAIKINNAEGTNPKVVNGQRIKHYISGTPINVESNIIQTLTPEDHIIESFRNTLES